MAVWLRLFRDAAALLDSSPIVSEWTIGGGTMLIRRFSHRQGRNIDILRSKDALRLAVHCHGALLMYESSIGCCFDPGVLWLLSCPGKCDQHTRRTAPRLRVGRRVFRHRYGKVMACLA